MKILRRTFEAKNYPKGSEERKHLNENPTTSEYMPSYKYIVEYLPKGSIFELTRPFTRDFRTKKEAEAFTNINL